MAKSEWKRYYIKLKLRGQILIISGDLTHNGDNQSMLEL